MRVTKRQLNRIIREERIRLRVLKEQEAPAPSQVDTREHQWPSADGPISDAAGELSVAWNEMEINAWSAGDPSMNKGGELSDAESKAWWTEQVDAATDQIEEALSEKLRAASIQVMEEYTDMLINGDFS